MEPKLRKVWIENDPQGGADDFRLVDPLRLAEPYPIDRAQLAAVRLMDGKQDLREIRAVLEQQGIELAQEGMKTLAGELEQRGLTDGERFRSLLRDARVEFERLNERPYLFQGESFPEDPEELERILSRIEEPGLQRATGWREVEHGPVNGIVAPHIDPVLATEEYAQAYCSAPEGAPLLFVLLGSSHQPTSTRLVLTKKDFRTPHGVLQTDPRFVDRLDKLAGGGLFADEILHRTEHSLEFQALYLRYRYRRSGPGAVRIAPILVGSFADFIRAERYPGDIPEIKELLGALRQVIDEHRRSGERVVLVAGVDFAHLGEKFGDQEPITPELLAELERTDRASLARLEKMDGRGFYESLAVDGNARRWCGLAPLTCLAETVQADRGVTLAYGRDHKEGQTYVVTYGAMTFHEDPDD